MTDSTTKANMVSEEIRTKSSDYVTWLLWLLRNWNSLDNTLFSIIGFKIQLYEQTKGEIQEQVTIPCAFISPASSKTIYTEFAKG